MFLNWATRNKNACIPHFCQTKIKWGLFVEDNTIPANLVTIGKLVSEEKSPDAKWSRKFRWPFCSGELKKNYLSLLVCLLSNETLVLWIRYVTAKTVKEIVSTSLQFWNYIYFFIIYERNNSWKPEFGSSFNMGNIILGGEKDGKMGILKHQKICFWPDRRPQFISKKYSQILMKDGLLTFQNVALRWNVVKV